MPCRYDGPTDFEKVSAALHETTRLLCETIKELELFEQGAKGWIYPSQHVFNRVTGLRDWWSKHKAADEARIAREFAAREQKMLRDSALSKLTVEEAKALGILK